MTSSSRVVGIALAAVAVLAGCGGDDDGGSPTLPPVLPVATTGSPAGTASASASADRAASASSGPGAKAAEKAAVEAAVRYYFDGFRRAYETGDPQELAKGSTEDCPCRRAVTAISKAIALGEVTGGEVKVIKLDITSINELGATANVTIINPDGVVTTPDGQERVVPGEGRAQKGVLLKRTGGGWKVALLIKTA